MAMIAFEVDVKEEEKDLIKEVLQMALVTYIVECKGSKFLRSALPDQTANNLNKLIEVSRKLVDGVTYRLVVK